MAVDFMEIVQRAKGRLPLRPLVDLRDANKIKTDLWLNFNPSTVDSSLKSALTKVKNAPVSTSFWDSVKQSVYDTVTHPVTQGVLNTLDAPRNALFTQIDRWTDNDLSWGDIPLVGAIQGAIGSYTGDKVGVSDFLERAGWENKEGWQSGWSREALLDNLRDILSFAGDVALDPTTYLTLGAGSAVKHSAKAAKEALEAGLEAGTKEFDEFVEKAARAEANNQLIGFSIPFGQEITLAKKFGPLKVTTQKIGAKPAADLARKMADLGLTNEQRYRLASQMFGREITSFRDLTTQEFDHLNNALNNGLADKLKQWAEAAPDPFASPFVRASDNVEVLQPRQLPEGSANLPAVRTPWEDAIHDGTRLSGQSVVYGGKSAPASSARNIVEAEFTDVNPADAMLDELAQMFGKNFRHFEGADGVSQIGKLLKGNRVAETLGKYLGGKRYVPLRRQLEDHRIKQATGIMEDARLGGFARARAAVDEMAKLVKEPEIKALTKEEMELIPYFIEGKFPKSFDPSTIPADRIEVIQKAVDKFKEYRDKFTQAEQAAGVPYQVRDNYFPHILNMPEEGTDEFQAWLAKLQAVDPDLARRIQNAPRGFTRQRKLFQTMADLRDYLDANPAAKEVFGNAVFNPAEALARRAMAGAREVAKFESYKQLKDLGVAQRLAPGQKMPKGWRMVDVPGLENFIVPEEVAQKMNDLTKILTNDVTMNKFLNNANKAYTIWRRNATVLGLGFHVRQMIGNIFQNTLAGVTPKAYNDAAKVLIGKSVKIRGQELPADVILNMAREDGVLGTGSSADFLEDLTKELGTRLDKGNAFNRYINVFSDQFALGRLGRNVGEAEDNFARLAHYIWALDKSGSRQMARESVRKYLFDYSNLTNFERGVMRTIFPFYNWMRNNLPFQIAQAVKRPGLYQVLDDLQASLTQDPAADPLLEEAGFRGEDAELMKQLVAQNGGVLPEYIRERYMKVGDNDYFNIGLPSSDLYNLDQPGEVLKQSINPAVQWATGMISNRNVFGAPIDRYSDQLSLFSPEGLRFTLEQFGGAPGRFIGHFLPDSAGVSKSDEMSLMETLGKLLGVTQVDPAKQLESLLYQKAREADAAKKREKARNGS